jgi:hypothetical protein
MCDNELVIVTASTDAPAAKGELPCQRLAFIEFDALRSASGIRTSKLECGYDAK